MPVPAKEFFKAADGLLKRLERDALANKKEVQGIRDELVAASKKDSSRALAGMKTTAFGRTRVLVPTPKNLQRLNLASQRTRERFSRFKLQWLNKGEVRSKISQGFTAADQANFFRHSNRLARNAKLFLAQIAELEPTLKDEVDATVRQINDASNDLLKLEIRSFTTARETLLRAVNGKMTRSEAEDAIRTFDLNRNLWNLSLLEHPKAVVRDLLSSASERMASRAVRKKSEIPKKALVFVGAGPDAVSKMTEGSRTAQVLWRLFSAEKLSKRFKKLNAGRVTTSSHRGLGQDFGTNEFYVPVAPEIEEEVREELGERRKAFLEQVRGRTAPSGRRRGRTVGAGRRT